MSPSRGVNSSAFQLVPMYSVASKRGFTLVELIIAITVLVIGVVAVFGLSFFAIQLNRTNVQRLQALELAREGMEMIRNIRDSNWKNNYPFAGGAPLWGEDLGPQKYVKISPRPGDQVPFAIVTVNPQQRNEYRLNTVEVSGVSFFTHDTGTPSQFYRLLQIEPYSLEGAASDEAIKVTSQVLWLNGDKEHTVEVTEILTNWRKI